MEWEISIRTKTNWQLRCASMVRRTALSKLYFGISVLPSNCCLRVLHYFKNQNCIKATILIQRFRSTQFLHYSSSIVTMLEPKMEFPGQCHSCYWYCPVLTHEWHHRMPHLHPSETARYLDQAKPHIRTKRHHLCHPLHILHRPEIAAHALYSKELWCVIGDYLQPRQIFLEFWLQPPSYHLAG